MFTSHYSTLVQMASAKKRNSKRHFREAHHSGAHDEDDVIVSHVKRKPQRHVTGASVDEAEVERCLDIQERDAFAERLKEKDKEKTRKIVERSNKKVSIENVHLFVFSVPYFVGVHYQSYLGRQQ